MILMISAELLKDKDILNEINKYKWLESEKACQISDLKGPQGNGSISTLSNTSLNILGNLLFFGSNHNNFTVF